MMSSDNYDVVVIGGGMSGLSAAKRLEEHGVRVLVLEAKNRVGGRMLSGYSEKNGFKVDLGGAYVHPKQRRIMRLAKEYKIQTYDVYDEGSVASEYKGKVLKTSLPGTIFEKLDFIQGIVALNKLTDQFDPQNPKAWKDYKKYDSISINEWLDSQCVTEFAKDALLASLEGGFCNTTDKVSMFDVAYLVKASGGLVFGGATSGGAQEKKFIGGSAQIPECVAKDLQNLKLQHVVCRIEQNDDGAVVYCENDSSFSCKYVIMAIAPPLMKNIAFVPELPDRNKVLVDTMRHGKVVKTIMYYDEPFWRKDGYSGATAFTNTEGPLLSSLDDCSPKGDYAALVGFMHTAAENWMKKPIEERKQAIAEQYRRAFKNEKALTPIDYAEHDWRQEEYLPGCYGASCILGTRYDNMESFHNGFKRIHFAGTETATINPGYIDGAVQAGERAANSILAFLDVEHTVEPIQKEKFPKLGPVTKFIGSSFKAYLDLRKHF